MLRKYKKNIVIILIGIFIVFSWLWTEGFGIAPKYAYGGTIERALNFWYERGKATSGFSKIVSTVDVDKDKKLVFYETNKNTLSIGLVKKKWNNKWIVIRDGGDFSSDYLENKDTPKDKNSESKSVLDWGWCNLSEFGVTVVVAYDSSVKNISVGENKAILVNENTNKYLWYSIDKIYAISNTLPNVKAYNKDNKLIYKSYSE